MARTKLYRNLKSGDKFRVSREDGVTAIVTVTQVHEVHCAWFTNKRQWEVHGDYPFWWPWPIRAYSDERCTLVT